MKLGHFSSFFFYFLSKKSRVTTPIQWTIRRAGSQKLRDGQAEMQALE